jgi:2-amino-4-hydroxy-6-hydroxymethyldihydropteridine diphosphokinase
MRKIYLSIGSNKGNRYSFIKEALRLIQKDIGEVILISKIYETKSWGFQSDDFLNLCILIKSKLIPVELIIKLKNLEERIGRERNNEKIEAREIDIDILFYSDEIVNQKDLIIPHQRLHLRNFVLYPLNDIAADFMHPVLLKSVNKLLNECEDDDTPKESLLSLS